VKITIGLKSFCSSLYILWLDI